MLIYVPRTYYTDEVKYKAIKQGKKQLREMLGCDKINYRFKTDGDIYCSDETKNDIVRNFILSL